MAEQTDLPVRTLGRTGLRVTQLGYGALQANIAAVRKGPLPADVYAEARRRLASVAA